MADNRFGKFQYSIIDGKSIMITKYDGDDSSLIIPESIAGLSVTHIGYAAFQSTVPQKTLERIIVPKSIVSIGAFAFAQNRHLTSITFQNPDIDFQEFAFTDCESLRRIVLPSRLKRIPRGLFYGCIALQTISIPQTVKNIDSSAFSNCSALDNVIIPYDVDVVEAAVFSSCLALSSIRLSPKTRVLGQGAFYHCESLKGIEFPEGLIEISRDAFLGCTGLEQICLPASLNQIGDGAFYKCTRLSSFSLATGNQTFATVGHALYHKSSKQLLCYPAGCTNSAIRVPKGTLSLSEKAFSGNTYLCDIHLPASIASIDASAFFGCDALTNLSIYEQNARYEVNQGVLFDRFRNRLVYYHTGLTYKTYSIPNGISVIGEGAFARCKLKTVVIPNTVQRIEKRAFSVCKELESMSIPDSVTVMESFVFNGAEKLVDIRLSERLSKITTGMFMLCTSLRSIKIPIQVKSIEAQAFQFCSSLKEAILPRSLIHIADDAFDYCESLLFVAEKESFAYTYAVRKKIKIADSQTASAPETSSTDNATGIDMEEKTPSDRYEGVDEELDELIGLSGIKDIVKRIVGSVLYQKKRATMGYKTIPMSLHLVFTGNPGTGKTTVARIPARIYKENGVLEKGHLVEAQRADLVAEYVGQTATKTMKKIQEAMGGILFIDEAYTLAKEGNDYGQEAIDTLLKAMEDNRDRFIVIVAGYKEPMQKLINSNPGLKSRFNMYVDFPDYTADELIEIFHSICDKYDMIIEDKANTVVEARIKAMEQNKGPHFANARDVRNLFESILTRLGARVGFSDTNNRDDIRTIRLTDVEGI